MPVTAASRPGMTLPLPRVKTYGSDTWRPVTSVVGSCVEMNFLPLRLRQRPESCTDTVSPFCACGPVPARMSLTLTPDGRLVKSGPPLGSEPVCVETALSVGSLFASAGRQTPTAAAAPALLTTARRLTLEGESPSPTIRKKGVMVDERSDRTGARSDEEPKRRGTKSY
eukprot:scaffold101330_cov67-Phaeocystis_antarctica.AAC.5